MERAKPARDEGGDDAQREDQEQLQRERRLAHKAARENGIGDVPGADGQERAFFQGRGSEVRQVVARGDRSDDGQFAAPELANFVGASTDPVQVIMEHAVEGFAGQLRGVARETPIDAEPVLVIDGDGPFDSGRAAQEDAAGFDLRVIDVEFQGARGKGDAQIPHAPPLEGARHAPRVAGQFLSAAELEKTDGIEIAIRVDRNDGFLAVRRGETEAVGGVIEAVEFARCLEDHPVPDDVVLEGAHPPKDAVAVAARGDVTQGPGVGAKERVRNGLGFRAQDDVAGVAEGAREIVVGRVGKAIGEGVVVTARFRKQDVERDRLGTLALKFLDDAPVDEAGPVEARLVPERTAGEVVDGIVVDENKTEVAGVFCGGVGGLAHAPVERHPFEALKQVEAFHAPTEGVEEQDGADDEGAQEQRKKFVRLDLHCGSESGKPGTALGRPGLRKGMACVLLISRRSAGRKAILQLDDSGRRASLTKAGAVHSFELCADAADEFLGSGPQTGGRGEINGGRRLQDVGRGAAVGRRINKDERAVEEDPGGIGTGAAFGAADAGDAIGHFDFVTGGLGELVDVEKHLPVRQVQLDFDGGIGASVGESQFVERQGGFLDNPDDSGAIAQKQVNCRVRACLNCGAGGEDRADFERLTGRTILGVGGRAGDGADFRLAGKGLPMDQAGNAEGEQQEKGGGQAWRKSLH